MMVALKVKSSSLYTSLFLNERTPDKTIIFAFLDALLFKQ